MLLLLLCLLAGGTTISGKLANNVTANKITLLEGEVTSVNTTVTFFIGNRSLPRMTLVLKCRMDDLLVGVLANWTDLVLTEVSQNIFVDIKATIVAKRLGRSRLLCSLFETNKLTSSVFEIVVTSIIVKREATIHETIFRYGLITLIVVITFVMGCDLDLGIIVTYLKRPISPAIGFFCQFLLMPILSFSLAKLTFINSAFGFGLLTVGCSPGGGASNIWAVLFGGDLNLSMTMTFLSSCAALFMMPFWFFALGRFFVAIDDITIPYVDIALNLLQIVIPAGLGMLFRWKCKKAAASLSKKMKIMGLVYVIFVFSYGTYANFYLFKMMYDYPYLIPIGAGLPWLGFLFGYLISLASLRSRSHCVVIALETGIQNIAIAVLILKYSMQQPAGDFGAVITLIVAVFTPIPLYLGFAILTIKQKCFDEKKKDENSDNSSDNTEEKEDFLGKSATKINGTKV